METEYLTVEVEAEDLEFELKIDFIDLSNSPKELLIDANLNNMEDRIAYIGTAIREIEDVPAVSREIIVSVLGELTGLGVGEPFITEIQAQLV